MGTIFVASGRAAALADQILYYYPCDHPVQYKIGAIDSRFELSLAQAKKEIVNSAELWNQTWGKTVLEEDPKADLTVNFIYDQRQELSTKVKNMEEDVTQNRNDLDRQAQTFKLKAANLEKQISDLNAKIAEWNAKGGAPQDVYDSLTSQQRDLQSQIDQARSEAQRLNASVNSYNSQVDQFNSTVSDFNSVVAAKPEEGFYDGRNGTISIYYVNSRDELAHTLIHEFGHAISVDHVTNPEAIMYPMSSETTKFSPEDLAALQKACTKISKFPAITTVFH